MQQRACRGYRIFRGHGTHCRIRGRSLESVSWPSEPKPRRLARGNTKAADSLYLFSNRTHEAQPDSIVHPPEASCPD